MFEKGAAEETYKVAVAGLEATSVTPCALQYSKYKILIRGIAEHTCVEGEGELISDMAEWLGVQVSELSFRLQSGTMAETFMLMKLVRRRGEEGLRHISMLRNLCALSDSGEPSRIGRSGLLWFHHSMFRLKSTAEKYDEGYMQKHKKQEAQAKSCRGRDTMMTEVTELKVAQEVRIKAEVE